MSQTIDAPTALQVGLVNKVVPAAMLQQATRSMAAHLRKVRRWRSVASSDCCVLPMTIGFRLSCALSGTRFAKALLPKIFQRV